MLTFTYFQGFSFFGEILINETFSSDLLVLLFDFIDILDDFFDSDSLFSDPEHIPFFNDVLPRWQRLDDDPWLLFCFLASANDGVGFIILSILFFVVGEDHVDGCICALNFIFIFVFVVVRGELVVAIEFEYPGLVGDVEHFSVD